MQRWSYFFLIVLTIGLGWFGLSRLSYNVEVLDLLPQDMDGLYGTRVMRDSFQKANRLVITLEGQDPAVVEAASLSLADHLASLTSLCHKVSARPPLDNESGQAAGNELAGMVAYALLNAPPEEVQSIKEKLSGGGAQKQAAAMLEELSTSQDPAVLAAGAYDPLGLTGPLFKAADPKLLGATGAGNGYRSNDGTFHLVFAEPLEATADYHLVMKWLNEVRRQGIVAWQAKHPEYAALAVAFTGEPAFRAEISTGMEKDMSQSVGGITFIVAFLFWLLHRTIKPLILLMAGILMTNLLTLGIAGMIYGGLNVMSMGFAAILTGMIEDFGVVALHEAQAMKGATWKRVCRSVLPGVIWSALTTAFVFGSLSLSSLPGVAQMGTLTALGILIGAAIMLFGFLPLAMKLKVQVKQADFAAMPESAFRRSLPGWCGGILLAACVAILLTHGLPTIHRGPNVLRPVNSESFSALERMMEKMEPPENNGEWAFLVASAPTEGAVSAAIKAAGEVLVPAMAAGKILSWYLPGRLLPDGGNQAANLPKLQALAAESARLEAAITDAGYEDEACALTRRVLGKIGEYAAVTLPPPAVAGGPPAARWPEAMLMEGTLGTLLQRGSGQVSVLGFVQVPPGQLSADTPVLAALEQVPDIYPAGWRYLNQKILPLVQEEATRICLPAGVVMAVLLVVVFRGAREIMLALGTLVFSGLILLAFMSFRRMEWNFVNITAIPLSLGLGLDFTIHMIYALRRHEREGGDGTHGVGRALAYCGLSTGLGFGALAVSGNTGLISMGWCCMVGVLATLFTSAFILPWAWRIWPRRRSVGVSS